MRFKQYQIEAFADVVFEGNPAAVVPPTWHSGLTAEERAKTGVTDSLIRFSVGIEETDDILDDLFSALSDASG